MNAPELRYAVALSGKVSTRHATALEAEQAAAQLRVRGFHAYAKDMLEAPRTREPVKGTNVVRGFCVRCSAFTSRVYATRAAAEDLVTLARRDGHADATVVQLHGVDDAQGLFP